ncbi:MAG: OmpA family protein [Candidatus Gastranaerophilales bacterium]|nr:OmpA family protein [Candidatus Gastranaerophilales bacterium]
MAKKQKHPEHINLERWLISYADFITLLFATFVVLYALSQVDIKDFKALENSIQQAFAAPSLMQGAESVMENSSDNLFETSSANSMIAPLMMEYISQKYEEQSIREIQKSVEEATKEGEIEGVESFQTDRGLVLRFNDDYLFESGSAALTQKAKTKLNKVGAIIIKKFVLHNMRIEGHTDNQPISSKIFPSNWELSSARASSIIRYFISGLKFMPGLFSAVGFADTRPIADNSSPAGRAKNRRIEILILKNKFKSQESPVDDIVKMSKQDQEKLQAQRIDIVNQFGAFSDAAKKNINEQKEKANAAVLNQIYDKETQRLSKEAQAVDKQNREKFTGQGTWLKPPAKQNFKVFE